MTVDFTEQIHAALVRGELGAADLSARRIADKLGCTTGALYHRHGSFDGFLFAISQRAFRELGATLAAVWDETRDLGACAETFVAHGLDHPELYHLMFERRYDWSALRRAGAFETTTPSGDLLAGVVCLLEAAGSPTPLADTRLLMAGLHGLVSFAASGRMNVGELASTDRTVAIAGARDLARRLLTQRT